MSVLLSKPDGSRRVRRYKTRITRSKVRAASGTVGGNGMGVGPHCRDGGACVGRNQWCMGAEGRKRRRRPRSTVSSFLVPGSWFHGVHGLAFNKDDQLFAGSVIGQTLYRVQVDSGEVDRVIDPPTGMADDIAFADDGTMAWTAFLIGKVYVRKPNGKTIEVANGMSGPNSLAFGKDGTAVRLRGLPRRRPLRDRHQERRQARLQAAGAQRAAPHRREAGRPQRLRRSTRTTASSTGRSGSRARS